MTSQRSAGPGGGALAGNRQTGAYISSPRRNHCSSMLYHTTVRGLALSWRRGSETREGSALVGERAPTPCRQGAQERRHRKTSNASLCAFHAAPCRH